MHNKNLVQPIRDLNKIQDMYKYFKSRGKYRDWLLFQVGLNFALRISDLLRLRIPQLYTEAMSPVSWTDIREQKTNKLTRVNINSIVRNVLEHYAEITALQYSDDFLFKSRKGSGPITRVQAYRIIREAAQWVGIRDDIGTHTLRKTWGYHAYITHGMSLDSIMLKLNHASLSATRHYIGLSADDKKEIDNIVSF